jgi:ApaG protein
MYEALTNDIKVIVEPIYLDEQSDPAKPIFVWAYHIKLENCGQDTVQLLTRYWRITNAMGQVEEVEGEGVIGKQPTLAAGEKFEYASGVPLTTPTGFMEGTYHMSNQKGERFDVVIPAFSLDSPHQSSQLN